MPKPRNQQICLEATPFYHCVSRCVRKAYLCGFDLTTKTSYEHRRAWLEEELLKQADVFAIDIAAYAIMSNHYHVVLHINKAKADAWDLDEVIERWHTLYKGNALSQRYRAGENLLEVELEVLNERAQKWRKENENKLVYGPFKRKNIAPSELRRRLHRALLTTAIHGLHPSGSLKAVQKFP
jgi:predicted metal-dependent HD superfamily phosphohydrolase